MNRKTVVPLGLVVTSMLAAQAPTIKTRKLDAQGNPIRTISAFVDVSSSNRHLFDNGFQLGRGPSVTVQGAVYKKVGKGTQLFGGGWYQHSKVEGPKEVDFFTGIRKTFQQGSLAGATIEGGYKHWDYLHQFESGVDWKSNNVGFAKISYKSFWDTQVGIDYHLLHMKGAKNGNQVSAYIEKELYLGRTNTGHDWSITPGVTCTATDNFFGVSSFPAQCGVGIKSSWRKGPLEGYIGIYSNAVMRNGQKLGTVRIGVSRTFRQE